MAGERPILIVDDDGALRETLVEQLEIDGEFTAAQAATLAEAEAMLNTRDARFDAVILDVTLPDGEPPPWTDCDTPADLERARAWFSGPAAGT